MKDRLLNNPGLKILSIFLAFFVWLVVMNISNPEVTRMKEVPLEIENEQILLLANRTYELNGKSTVTVTYSVRARDEYKIRATDFRAYIDLAELYDVTGSVQIKIDVINNKEIILDAAARPGVVSIQTEELQKKRFELELKTSGEPADDYAVIATSCEPRYVYLEGPASQVGLISTVGLNIDVTGKTEDLIDKAKPEFYNANDNTVTSTMDRVKVDVSEVNYVINISKAKRLNIDFEVSGTAAEGFQYAGVESRVRTVSVIGLKTNLAAVTKITIPASVLNVDGAVADKEVQVDLRKYLSDGVELAKSENAVIVVRLKVEPLVTKVFRLQESDIMKTGALNAYEYRIKPRQIELTMKGIGEDLDSLLVSDLEINMDVSGMGLGTHKGILTFKRNDVFTVIGYTDFEIEVVERIEPDLEPTSDAADDDSQTVSSTVESESPETENSASRSPEAETNTNTDTTEE